MRTKEVDKDFLMMIRQYEKIIFKVTSFYADQNQSINDLYQEVVINLWKAYPSFRGESKVSTWIYRISLNTCVTYFRRKKNSITYIDIAADIPDTSEADDNIKELYSLINRLGKIERALVLLYLDDKSYKEIADITGLTVTNVATKLSRIKEKLKLMSSQNDQ